MDKNTFLAITLSLAVLVGWTWLFPPSENLPPPTSEPELTTTENTANETTALSTNATALTSVDGTPSADVVTASFAEDIIVETDYLHAKINTQGGQLTSLSLDDYQHFKQRVTLSKWIPFLEIVFGKSAPISETENNRVEMLKRNLMNAIGALDVQFENNPELTQQFRNAIYGTNVEFIQIGPEDSSQQLVLTSPVISGVQVFKTLTFYPSTFVIDYKVQVINRSDADQPLTIRHIFGEGRVPDFPGQAMGYTHIGPMFVVEGDVETEDAEDLEGQPANVSNVQWLGIVDHYFVSAVASLKTYRHGLFEGLPVNIQGQRVIEPYFGFALHPADIRPGNMITSEYKLYYGPKDEAEMRKFGEQLYLSFDLTLETIAGPLLSLLRWIQGYVVNYGIAIIILTIIVRVVLFPLTYRGSKGMKRMQQLQPKVKKIQEKYKDNREKLGQEMMGLYKKHKINPVAGCLPLILQIPIFFGLYSALSAAVELRHAPFYFWIQDLSAPDGLGITPILMGVSMYFMQKMTPTGMMDPNHAKIMQMLPIIFTVFTFTFPAGLVLYWITSNVLSIGQQYIINRIKLPDMPE